MKSTPIFKLVLLIFIVGPTLSAGPTLEDLENSYRGGSWAETVEIAHELILAKNNQALPKLRGAYALIQLGYNNAALSWLKSLTPDQWNSVPKGQDRLVEIVALFQKKVPLNALPARMSQVRVDETSVHLHNEIIFARGREAFERENLPSARRYLSEIAPGSRFWSEAHYLLACISIKEKNLSKAVGELSAIFQNHILDQSTEFWQDFSSEMTSHWGPNIKVNFDAALLSKSKGLGELGTLAEARIAYAQKEFARALSYYDQIDASSKYRARATLEKIWTLLALNRHEAAAETASAFSSHDSSFESIEARPLGALILADAGKAEEAREAIDSFVTYYRTTRERLKQTRAAFGEKPAPAFLVADLADDTRLSVLGDYTARLTTEIANLRLEDRRVFPVFEDLARGLQTLLTDSKTQYAKIVDRHISKMLDRLDHLYVQAKLIKAETYLEDRERVRNKFSSGGFTAEMQREHDLQLVSLLDHAVREVDEATQLSGVNQLNLQFRQAELLWELSGARLILSQASVPPGSAKEEEIKSHQLQVRALKIAREIKEKFPSFSGYAEAYFFVGFAEVELEETERGLKTLREFLARFPNSDRAPDAYRIVADSEFEAGLYSAAGNDYKKILNFPNSSVLGYALYKIGWCAYNERRYAEALRALEEAIHWADASSKNNRLITLEKEARRDLIAIYAEIGDVSKAAEYFRNVLKDDPAPWIDNLAQELDRQGQYEKSAELYQTLIDLNPGNSVNLNYETSIMWGAYKLHEWPKVRRGATNLEERYTSVMSTPTKDPLPSANTERVFRTIVLEAHREFDNSAAPADGELLNQLDKSYLTTFDAWPEIESVLYRHAYYLLKRGDFAGSANSLREYWNRFAPGNKPERREEALRNLIHSLDKVETKTVPEKGKGLSVAASEIIDWINVYQKEFPKGRYSRPIAFLGSVLLFKYGESDRGINESQKMFDAKSDDEIAKRAFQNLRVAYYDRADWEKTYQWASELAKRKAPGMERFADDLRVIRQESLFLTAQAITDDAKSGDLFLKLSNDAEMQPLWEKSLYNAYVRFEKAGKKTEAVQAARRLQEMFPTNDGLKQLSGSRAGLYQGAGDYLAAYPQLVSFLKHAPKDTPAPALEQARLNAGLIAEATDRRELAIGFFNDYLKAKTSTTPAGRAEAERALARLQKSSGRTPSSLPPSEWVSLQKAEKSFTGFAISKAGSLPDQIRQGGEKLQRLAKRAFAFAEDSKSDPELALEAYCSVPFLYLSYGRGLKEAGAKLSADIAGELAKIASPLEEKANELGQDCIKRSAQAEHDGARFREALKIWGWQKDPSVNARFEKLLGLLQASYPWVQNPVGVENESEILGLHLAGQGNEETWYHLARLRGLQKKNGLCRLTLVDAFARFPASGKILNYLAVTDEKNANSAAVTDLFKKAAALGDKFAYANLAVRHFRGGRLEEGLSALREAENRQVFSGPGPLNQAVTEWLGEGK